jgi:hypothetical protein
MIRSLTSILILTLCLSHCAISTTDMVNISAAVYGGMEKKPNPLGAIKLLKKKDKNDK